MVPARLTLRNFLCYRDPPEDGPTLDFTGIQVACLSGENGNGKSALLDAMTWALWGQARARTDDELIHLGRTEMEVEFEFYAGEQRYRVIRKRRRGTQRTAGSTALEFQIATPDGWKALTANHVRETEQRVRDVLKLDYETFVNSAFLLQGRADMFTVKTPGERKRILAEILGLSRYDDLEQQARYERGLRDDLARSFERELAGMEAALALEPGYTEERQRLALTLSVLDVEIARSGEGLDSLRQAAKLAALQREQLAQAERRNAEASAEVGRAQEQLALHQREAARLGLLTKDADTIRDGYARLQRAVAMDQLLNERFQRHAELQRLRAATEAEVQHARAELATQEGLLARELERLEGVLCTAAELDAQRLALEERSSQLDLEESRLRGIQAEGQTLRERAASLRTENAKLRAEMDAIKQKQLDLADATVCPLCRTELGEGGQRHIVEAYEAEGRRLAAQFREKRSQIDEGEQRCIEIEAQAGAVEPSLRRDRVELAREQGSLESSARDAAGASARLPEQRAALIALRARLETGDYALEHARRRDEIDAELTMLEYHPSAHERVRQTVAQLRPFDDRHRDLGIASTRLEGECRALEEAQRSMSEWQVRRQQCQAEAEQLRSNLAAQPDSGRRLAEAEACHVAFLQQQRQHQLALGAVEQKLDDCAQLRAQQGRKTAELKKALEERGIYDELAGAFSKRGIQALIIDHVLPEITEEANRLLARMSNSRLQVMMDTQRQTLKGGVTETLDIRISDELGTRNYEMFSGGEAFRVNLALRIALSKLLARRAGAPLPTLVIDEGFGSQDSAALERLIEAINVIQSDFRCLLVITHLTEMKDQFPVQIAVSKTADGSTATVVA